MGQREDSSEDLFSLYSDFVMSHFPLEGDSTPTTGAMSTVVANTNSQVANFAVDSALSGTSPTSSQSAASSQFQRLKVKFKLNGSYYI